MEIEILSVSGASAPRVYFRSAWGDGIGLWMGDEMPNEGYLAHVEIDLPEDSPVFSVHSAEECSEPAFRQVGGLMEVVGRVERIAEDGVIELRVGSDVVVLDAVPDRSIIIEGQCIRVTDSSLVLYPLDL